MFHVVRRLVVVALVLELAGLGVPTGAVAQHHLGDVDEAALRRVAPEAVRFGEPTGDPPVIEAFGVDPVTGIEVLIGYVFDTSDIPPLQIGYSGPIEALVGMDLEGRITGIRVLDYFESLMRSQGDFLSRRGFQEQFAGKRIEDQFRVYGDVSGLSRATITVRALARGVRDSARRVAEVYFAPPDEMGRGDVDLETITWFEMLRRGMVPRITVANASASAVVSLVLVPDDAFGARLIGATALASARNAIADRGRQEHLLAYGVEGSRLSYFGPAVWAVTQDGDTTRLDEAAIRPFGLAGGGLMRDQLTVMGAMIVPASIDMSRAFSILYDLRPDASVLSAEFAAEAVAASAAGMHAADPPAPGDGSAEPLPVTVGLPDGKPATGVLPQVAPQSVGVSGGQPAAFDPSGAVPAANALSDPSRAPEALTYPLPARADPADSLPARADPSDPLPAVGDPADPRPVVADSADPLPAAGARAESLPGGIDPAVFSADSDETELARSFARTSGFRLGGMALALVLATAAFLLKTTVLRWVALAYTVVYLGFFDGGFLSVSHITSGIWVGPSVYLSDLPLLLLVTFTVGSTLLFGRVFCGFLCPFGAVQDFITRWVPRRFRRRVPDAVHRRAKWLKYGVLAAILVPALAGSHASLYQYAEPFGTVFFLSPSVGLWAIAVVLLTASAVVPRFYCRYACPLGAALAVGSVLSLKRIGRVEQCSHCKVCEQKCPTDAIRGPTIDFPECVRCNICEVALIEQAGVCRHDAATVRSRLVQIQVGGGARAR